MLAITGSDTRKTESLDDMIGSLEAYPEAMSLGRDIDAAHRVMFER